MVVLDARIRRTAFVVCLVALFESRSIVADATFEKHEWVSSEIDTHGGRDNTSDKVQVELYYMSQCPSCRQLISESFFDAFKTPGFSDMADVIFVPFGHVHTVPAAAATTTGSGNGERQSEERVFDNVLESCALHTIGSLHQEQQFSYIDCIDHHVHYEKVPSKVDRECARAIGLSARQRTDIEDCAASPKGHALAEQNVLRSEEVNYVPWIVVDGIHSVDIETSVWESIFHVVCGVYSGPHRSRECRPASEYEHDHDQDTNTFGGSGGDGVDLIAEQL